MALCARETGGAVLAPRHCGGVEDYAFAQYYDIAKYNDFERYYDLHLHRRG